jgi:hypothetical protein
MKLHSRQFTFGDTCLESRSADLGAAPYIIGGPHIYAIGHGSAEVGPIGAEHLVGEMGGIWAHPLRLADGICVDLLGPDGDALPAEGAAFHEGLGAARWLWRCAGLRVERHDSALPAAPAYLLRVTLANDTARHASGALLVTAHLAFRGAWFGGSACDGGVFRQDCGLIVGEDTLQPDWGLALGCADLPDACAITPRERGALATLCYAFRLAPGEQRAWSILLVAAHQGGGQMAASLWRGLNDVQSDSAFRGPAPGLRPPSASLRAGPDPGPRPPAPFVFAQGRPGLRPPASGPRPPPGPALACATGDLALNCALAQANLALLRASYPDLGGYFLAGLPEYPQLFGCDTAYSVAGATAGGLGDTVGSALAALARYAERACGRVPHEVTTNGRVFHPGNIQETPQLTIAVWDYLRWSGDLDLARGLFPVLREGMLELLPTACGPYGHYPYGDGMVERLGMGSRKLDSACYAIAGLVALSRIAAALGLPDAQSYAERAEPIRVAFEADWWIESEGLYGDSMHSDGTLQLDGHWTAVLPVQLGLAAPARARRVLDRIMAEFVNEWGLVHTRGREELVWTLPTGLLSLALFAHGHAEAGLRLAENIAATARYGTLGTFKELIPQGLCFIQLWSAGLYLQAIFEGLLGLRPDAPAHRLDVSPCLPAGLAPITLTGLRVGGHLLDLTLSAQELRLHHRHGPQPLRLSYANAEIDIAPGETGTHVADAA